MLHHALAVAALSAARRGADARLALDRIIPEHPKHDKGEIQSNNTYLTRRIGSTTYKIKVHFDDTSREAMEDKILRLIREESLGKQAGRGIMSVPQIGRQPERSQA